MTTSRKLRVKLAKHRRSARKTTSTEAAGEDPEPEQTERFTSEMPATIQRGTVTAQSALTGTQFVCFCHWLSCQKLLAALSLFTCTFSGLTPGPSGTQRQTTPGTSHSRQPAPQKHSWGATTAGIVKNLAVCLSHFPPEISPKYSLCFFILQITAPRKGNAKPLLTLTARQRPLQTATSRALSTLQPQRARTRKISSSRTTPQKS